MACKILFYLFNFYPPQTSMYDLIPVYNIVIRIIEEQMSKEIEMQEIIDNHDVVGTEIFDSNMPSNLDFDEKEEVNCEKASIIAQKVPEMGKFFRVKGKLISNIQPKFFPGVPITVPLNTHPVKMEDQQISGLKKLWSSIVGHSKREVLIQDGYIYFMQKDKRGYFVRSTICLANLFKVFVDPEEQKIRLVIKQQQHLANRDLYPDNFILLTERIQHELLKIGLSLVQ